jgi:tellurite resistance protein
MATNMDAAVITILQAMLAVAAVDGEIHEEEVATIRSIYKHLIGPDLDANAIRQTGQEMIADNFDIFEKLAERRKVIPPETKPDILRAVISVAGAHGPPGDEESRLIVEIAQALGLPDGDITNIIREFS